ncbi:MULTISPECIES: TrbI/VirB10 family protein [unclassified Phenylobacterium]|uniref:TrbI/VirB10 family protein n=1 Tax=unclassified Phenylobacterium TaxID=2640670 RepID=UPI00083A2693|nr:MULTISPECIES: TrbI/VirB10 family protein [unclassified Phenylobacterium]
MTAVPQDPPIPPKAPIAPLDARAPRPKVIRLRRSFVSVLVMGASGLVAGALAWAFVVQPELRANAQAARRAEPSEVRGAVRPSERVTDGPANYAQLDRLPPPRTLGAKPDVERSTPEAGTPAPPQPPPAPRTQGPEARASALFFAGDTSAGTPAPASGDGAPSRDYAAVYNTHALLAPISPYEIKAGSALPAALLTAIDTSRAGPVVAAVTENLFDTVTGRHLLVPQGSRLLGRHEGESRYGDTRAVIVWERLLLPNGKSLVLAKEPGVDAQGAVGVKGRVDRRLGSLAVATLFAGAITTLGQAARDRDHESGGLLGDAGDAAAIEAAQIGGKLIDRELDVRPVIRLAQGARVRVLVTRDLILEPYRP